MTDTTAPAIVQASDTASLMRIIERATTDPAFDVAKLQALLDVRDRWLAGEAKRAYDTAFAAFKAEAVRIVRNTNITDGPLRGKQYANLFACVDALTPALSRNGLSSSWSIVKDENEWIETACILKHVSGHSEISKMGGPPDTGVAKNAIQARASSLSYLERYTFLAVTGMATADQDDDGGGGGDGDPPPADPWTDELRAAGKSAAGNGVKAYRGWWRTLTEEFRLAAAPTKQHGDFKTVANDADTMKKAAA